MTRTLAAAGIAAALALSALPSLGVHAAPAAAAPTMKQINARLSHTIEIGVKGENFRITGHPLTVKDGRGTGTITAVIGQRWPTADAKGQVVFFWHNAVFSGMSANFETPEVLSHKSPAAGTFVITYARYKKSDPMCCPTLKPLKVTYAWSSNHTFISNGMPPKVGKPISVKYQP